MTARLPGYPVKHIILFGRPGGFWECRGGFLWIKAFSDNWLIYGKFYHFRRISGPGYFRFAGTVNFGAGFVCGCAFSLQEPCILVVSFLGLF